MALKTNLNWGVDAWADLFWLVLINGIRIGDECTLCVGRHAEATGAVRTCSSVKCLLQSPWPTQFASLCGHRADCFVLPSVQVEWLHHRKSEFTFWSTNSCTHMWFLMFWVCICSVKYILAVRTEGFVFKKGWFDMVIGTWDRADRLRE